MVRFRVVVLSVLALLLVVVLAACSSSPPTGSLKVTVSGLPTGVSGSVTVTGPGGYSKVVTATSTLSNLTLGTYSVAPAMVSGQNATVPAQYDGTASSTTLDVTQNTTASTTVTYAVRGGSGHVWVAQAFGSYEAVGYSSAQLAASGSPSPDVTISKSTPMAEGIAFDHAGNMWVADSNGYLYRYDAAQLASSGTPAPVVAVNATAYAQLGAVAFDAAGDLWVSGAPGRTELVEFTPAQLAASGTPTPTVVLSGTSGIAGAYGMGFDRNGNLWVANFTGNTVVEFTSLQLKVTGSPTPAVTFSGSNFSGADTLAFDASGNLWVGNYYSSTVVRLDKSQLAAGGSPTPAATINSASLVGGGPAGLAFDENGNLWVADRSTPELREFTNPDALSGSVTPAAAVAITGVGGADIMPLAFSPPSANLPINTP